LDRRSANYRGKLWFCIRGAAHDRPNRLLSSRLQGYWKLRLLPFPAAPDRCNSDKWHGGKSVRRSYCRAASLCQNAVSHPSKIRRVSAGRIQREKVIVGPGRRRRRWPGKFIRFWRAPIFLYIRRNTDNCQYGSVAMTCQIGSPVTAQILGNAKILYPGSKDRAFSPGSDAGPPFWLPDGPRFSWTGVPAYSVMGSMPYLRIIFRPSSENV
jgi:hypothetical protein